MASYNENLDRNGNVKKKKPAIGTVKTLSQLTKSFFKFTYKHKFGKRANIYSGIETEGLGDVIENDGKKVERE